MNLTMKNEIEKLTEWKFKRFSFFIDPQEKEKESHRTFGTLPFVRYTSQHNAKVKEPNVSDTHYF
jgi:hypothetical protein